MSPSKNDSLLERIADLELELLGQTFTETIAQRLSRLENESANYTRLNRLEAELDVNRQHVGDRIQRMSALDMELFGETYPGTTISSRLSRLETELLG